MPPPTDGPVQWGGPTTALMEGGGGSGPNSKQASSSPRQDLGQIQQELDLARQHTRGLEGDLAAAQAAARGDAVGPNAHENSDMIVLDPTGEKAAHALDRAEQLQMPIAEQRLSLEHFTSIFLKRGEEEPLLPAYRFLCSSVQVGSSFLGAKCASTADRTRNLH